MRHSRTAVFLFLIAVSLSSCEELPTAATVGAIVTLTASPSPATSVDSSDAAYKWATSFTITATESNGVGVTVGTVSVKVQQATGGIVVVPTSDVVEVYKFDMKATGNRVEARSSSPIGFDVLYTLPNGGREALVTVTINLSDDKGYTSIKTLQIRSL